MRADIDSSFGDNLFVIPAYLQLITVKEISKALEISQMVLVNNDTVSSNNPILFSTVYQNTIVS